MMSQQYASRDLTALPTDISSAQAKLVYLYLEATGSATVTELNEALAMNKMAVFSVLDSLSSQDLVEKRGDEYVTLA